MKDTCIIHKTLASYDAKLHNVTQYGTWMWPLLLNITFIWEKWRLVDWCLLTFFLVIISNKTLYSGWKGLEKTSVEKEGVGFLCFGKSCVNFVNQALQRNRVIKHEFIKNFDVFPSDRRAHPSVCFVVENECIAHSTYSLTLEQSWNAKFNFLRVYSCIDSGHHMQDLNASITVFTQRK